MSKTCHTGRIYIIFFFILLKISTSGQSIDSLITHFGQKFPREKIYVHFDKTIYYPGETVWFKAYLRDGIEPSGISSVLYAELIGPTGNILMRNVLPLFEGTGAGNFDLPAKLPFSWFRFRAYTTWMQNYDSSDYFQRDFRVAGIKAEEVVNKDSTRISIHFFPEGGDLVAGLRCNLAFKANDQFGIPVDVSGEIHDASGKLVVNFQSKHEGMGTVEFIPTQGQEYVANWNVGKRVESAILPATKKTGILLSVFEAGKAKGFMVQATDPLSESFQKLRLVAIMEQKLIYRATINIKPGETIYGTIPVKDFPSGVIQITVFDDQFEPVAERISFILNDNSEFVSKIENDSLDLRSRGKNVIEIDVPDTMFSNLSVSITDAGLFGQPWEGDHILSHMLLTSQLRGYIHNPATYFQNKDDSTREKLDLVMLTHGWRRYPWKDIFEGSLPEPKKRPENYLLLAGNLRPIPKKGLKKDEVLNVLIVSRDSSRQIVTIPMSASGGFFTDGLVFYDTVKLYYAVEKDKDKLQDAEVTFNNGIPPPETRLSSPVTRQDIRTDTRNAVVDRADVFTKESDNYRLLLEKKIKELSPVVVRTRVKTRKEILDETYTNGLFATGDDFSFDVVKDKTAIYHTNIFTYLNGKVPSLTIRGNSIAPTVLFRNENVALFLNEMRTDPETLSTVSISEIAYVKVFRPPFFAGFNMTRGGAIAIYTLKGHEVPEWGGLSSQELVGFSKPKEFYSPDYTQLVLFPELKDVRSTIYWNPFVFTDKDNQKVKLVFYNNDVSSKLQVTLEGMNANGKLTRVTKLLE